MDEFRGKRAEVFLAADQRAVTVVGPQLRETEGDGQHGTCAARSPAQHEPHRGLPASPPPDARAVPVRPALPPGRALLSELGGEPQRDAPGLPDPGALPGRGARGARSDARSPARGAAGGDGEEESVGAKEGAPEDREHQHRVRRAAGVYPQRASGHQTVENKNVASGDQLHRLPDGCAGQRLRGDGGLQGRDQEDRDPGPEEETRAGEFDPNISCVLPHIQVCVGIPADALL